MAISSRFSQAVKQGIHGIRHAYLKQREMDREREARRLARAKSDYERERIKAEARREQLKLEQEMWNAKTALKKQQEATDRAKREAGGGGSWVDRVGRFVSTTGKSVKSLSKSSGRSRRRTVRKVVRKVRR